MVVQRHIKKIIEQYLYKGKTIIIYGARQVGKTTLVGHLLEGSGSKILCLNGDESDVRELLSNLNTTKLKPVIGNAQVLVLDEAQRIESVGLVLKIIHDNFKDVQVIATGSSSFDLSNKIQEPMTGRKLEFMLYPFSFAEMCGHFGFLEEKRMLEHRLIFGYYPDITLNVGNEVKLLKSLTTSYLYKDLLMLDTIKKPVILEKILKALALQVGSEVSYNELAQLLDSDKGTIEKYIDLLEKANVIFRLSSFSRNIRNEIKRNRKIYFNDNGIRNAVLGNFTPLSSRTDKGALWENFIISERRKYIENNALEVQSWFWRTTQQQEIDYIEESNNKLYAWEFKWNPSRKSFLSKTFSRAYPETEYRVISPGNIEEFLLTAKG